MKVKWKKIKVAMPHCSVCGETFWGNNSEMDPYKCSCGIWKSSFENLLEFELIKKDK